VKQGAYYAVLIHYMGIAVFNRLPRNLKELSSDYIKFKSAIKNLLINQSFYSINEYLE
jgi:hypothetical protein